MALLQELGLVQNIIPKAIVVTLPLYASCGYAGTWYEELVGVVDEQGRPIPFIVLEGSTVAEMECRPWSTIHKTTKVKIAFQYTERFSIIVKRSDGKVRKLTLSDIANPLPFERHLYEYKIVENLPIMPAPERIAQMILGLIDAIATETRIDRNAIIEALRKRICR